MPWSSEERQERFAVVLSEMRDIFRADPTHAVRSQEFIKTFHNFIAEDLEAFLLPKAVKAGVKVVQEAKIFGSYKSKDVDVAVIHPFNGPLICVGVRSQMSSVGKNVLTYYQDIAGEAISLQERFPMAAMGYAYLHPLVVTPIQKPDGKWTKAEKPRHSRYARMYAGIGTRDDRLYKQMTGSYDEFAYAIVDFESDPMKIRDDIVKHAVPNMDMSIGTLVPRLVERFHARNLWVENIFEPTGSNTFPVDDLEDVEMDDALVEGLDTRT